MILAVEGTGQQLAGDTQKRLLVPQTGLEECRLHCLDAATGELLCGAPVGTAS